MLDNSFNKIKQIPLKCIRPNPCQPRKYFDPDSMEILIQSIERYGVINPVTVRDCGDNEYELISGERRFRAAYSAGLRTIPCIILDTDGSDCAILSLLENLQREDLSFLEIAESYRELIKKDGISSRDLSRKLGERSFDITQRMSLMSLDPIVRKYIRSFNLSEKVAKSLLKIKDNNIQIEVVRQICENSMSEHEAIEYIKDVLSSDVTPSIYYNKIKNMQIIRNTINNAVNTIKTSGIDAQFNEQIHDWGNEFIIKVKKPTL